MNSSFKLVDQQSMYNIIGTYNGLVDAMSQSGFQNRIKNPYLDSFMRSGGAPIKPFWQASFDLVNDGTGAFVEYAFSATDTLKQDIITALRPGRVYTAIISLKTTAAMEAQVYGSAGNVWSYTTDGIDVAAPDAVSVPASPVDASSGQRITQNITMQFATNSAGLSGNVYLELRGDGESASNVTIEVISMTEGAIAFSDAAPQHIFLPNIRYNTAQGYWEVSENTSTWSRLMIDNAAFETRLNEIGAVNFYNKAQSNSRFLLQSGGTATGKIYFNAGAEINQELKLIGTAALVMQGGLIQANVDQTGTAIPSKDFLLEVRRGDGITEANRAASLRWNESLDRWEYNNADGKFRGIGTGTGVTGGGGLIEQEYYAEVLENSGFKYGFFDLFDAVLDNVADAGLENNIDETYWYATNGTAASFPLSIRTSDIWNADDTGISTFFVTVLTSLTDNTGVDIFYNLTGQGVDATDWIPISANTLIDAGQEITNLWLKFSMTEACNFHSYGMFFGVWDYHFASTVRLREVKVISAAAAPPSSVVVPNGGQYTADGKSLEVFHNRVRLIKDVDYSEVAGGKSISMFKAVDIGDYLEFYEKFGYVDLSTENAVTISNHIDNTSIHVSGGEFTTINNHIADTTSNPHGVTLAQLSDATAITNHLAITAGNPHGVDATDLGVYTTSEVDLMTKNVDTFTFSCNPATKTIGAGGSYTLAKVWFGGAPNSCTINWIRWGFGDSGQITPRIFLNGAGTYSSGVSYAYYQGPYSLGTTALTGTNKLLYIMADNNTAGLLAFPSDAFITINVTFHAA